MSDAKTRFQFSLLTLSLIAIAYALGLATPKLVEYLTTDSSDGDAETVKLSLVVICTSSLEAGTEITNQDVTVENWPTTVVPDGGFTNINQVVGKTLKSSTSIGQPVTKAELQATKDANVKIRLSTLLLIVTAIALATGWLYERSSYESKLKSTVEREILLRSELMHAQHWSTIPYFQSTMSQDAFRSLHTEMLAGVVVDCWLMTEHIDSKEIYDEADRQALPDSAESALLQLNISDADSFRDLLVKIDEKYRPWDRTKIVVVVNDEGKLDDSLEAFINTILSAQERSLR